MAISVAKPEKFFYGWIIVAVAFLMDFAGGLVWNPVLSIFIKPLGQEFGWSRATIAGAVTLGTMAGGVLGPLVGPIIDRRGPRVVAVTGVVILGLSMVGLSALGSLWQFYFLYGLARLMGTAVIGMAASIAVANWFVARRGRAIGIFRLGVQAALIVFPILGQFLILNQGWRVAWFVQGALILAVVVAPTVLFLRRRPEDMGLRPDGPSPMPAKPGNPGHGATGVSATMAKKGGEPAWTRGQALRSQSFWLLLIAFVSFSMLSGGIHLHVLPYLTDVGIPAMMAVSVVSMFSIFGIAGNLLWGFLAERVRVRYCLAVVMLLSAASIGILMLTSNIASAYAFAVAWGIGNSGAHTLFMIAWPDYFGRAHLGSIRGMVSPFSVTANAVGPILAGWLFDTTGSYLRAFAVFAGLALLSAFTMLLSKAPSPQAGQI